MRLPSVNIYMYSYVSLSVLEEYVGEQNIRDIFPPGDKVFSVNSGRIFLGESFRDQKPAGNYMAPQFWNRQISVNSKNVTSSQTCPLKPPYSTRIPKKHAISE